MLDIRKIRRSLSTWYHFCRDYSFYEIRHFRKRKIIEDTERYVSIGFDDFRDSDFALIIPLLNEYNAKATFNRIQRKKKADVVERKQIKI